MTYGSQDELCRLAVLHKTWRRKCDSDPVFFSEILFLPTHVSFCGWCATTTTHPTDITLDYNNKPSLTFSQRHQHRQITKTAMTTTIRPTPLPSNTSKQCQKSNDHPAFTWECQQLLPQPRPQRPIMTVTTVMPSFLTHQQLSSNSYSSSMIQHLWSRCPPSLLRSTTLDAPVHWVTLVVDSPNVILRLEPSHCSIDHLPHVCVSTPSGRFSPDAVSIFNTWYK